MKITYIYHSSFVVELEQHILLFDYFKGKLPSFDVHKKLFVFVSHAHQDHFSERIFQIQHPHITYILSDDIKGYRGKHIHYVTFHEDIDMEDVHIKTLKSTDQGVAFLIHCEGKCIYHGGDLHWWDWKDEDTEEESHRMKQQYREEIGKLKREHIDVAFLPLDPRLQDCFYKGMDYFLRHVDTTYVFAMHMWDDEQIVERMKSLPCAASYKEKLIALPYSGKTFDLST